MHFRVYDDHISRCLSIDSGAVSSFSQALSRLREIRSAVRFFSKLARSIGSHTPQSSNSIKKKHLRGGTLKSATPLFFRVWSMPPKPFFGSYESMELLDNCCLPKLVLTPALNQRVKFSSELGIQHGTTATKDITS